MSENEQDTIPQHAPLVAALRYGAAGLVLVAVLSAIVSTIAAGTPGLWGALIGAGLGGAFILATALTMYFMREAAPTTLAAVMLGTWLLKLIIAIAVMAVLRDMDFYDKYALVFTVIAALVVLLGAETMGILRTNVPYVVPEVTTDTEDKS